MSCFRRVDLDYDNELSTTEMVSFLSLLNISLPPARRAALQEAMRITSKSHTLRFLDVARWIDHYLHPNDDVPAKMWAQWGGEEGLSRLGFCQLWAHGVLQVTPHTPQAETMEKDWG